MFRRITIRVKSALRKNSRSTSNATLEYSEVISFIKSRIVRKHNKKSVSQVDIENQDFYEQLGLDCLDIMELTMEIEEEYGINLDLSKMHLTYDLGGFAAEVIRQRGVREDGNGKE